MHTFHFTATVESAIALSPEQVSELVDRLISIGQEDAEATIEDAGNSDSGDVETARLAASLYIKDVASRLV